MRIVVTGTDTGVGKTVFCAGLTETLSACYWKPVQSGLEEETDSETVRRLGQLSADRVVPEMWRLRTPVSPHLAAAFDGVSLSADGLLPPDTSSPLVIEGAGGLLVPLSRERTFADVFANWRLPTVLCARTGLGTINHTLLTLEAMRSRSIPVLGVALIGEERPDTAEIIAELGKVDILGRLPWIEPLTPGTLKEAFRAAFDPSAFAGERA